LQYFVLHYNNLAAKGAAGVTASSVHLGAGAAAGAGVTGVGGDPSRIDVHDVSVMMMAASRATTPMGGPSRVRLPGQVRRAAFDLQLNMSEILLF